MASFAVLLLSLGVLLDISNAGSRGPTSLVGPRPAETHERQDFSAQPRDAATLPAGLALDACGVPFIADIEKFLDTCPASDPAMPEILNDFQIRRNGVLVSAISCSEPISQLPLDQYTDPLIVLQGLRVMYYMDRGRHGHLPWTSGSLYGWMKSRIQGIDIRDIPGGGGFCCEQFDGKFHIAVAAQDDGNREVDRKWEWISGNIGLYAHETRHVDGFGHVSCCGTPGSCDQTFDEKSLSAFGVQWWLNRGWLTGALNVGFSCTSPDRVQEIVTWYSTVLSYSGNLFCDNDPPGVAMPEQPGGQCPATAPDFDLNASPDIQNIEPGDSTTFTVEIGPAAIDQAQGEVRLCASVTPADSKVSVSISPESVSAGGTAILTVTAQPDALPGTLLIGVGGTAGLNVHTKAVTVTIAGPVISSAEIIGKHLYVYGRNFEDGAKVFVDAAKQKKTSNDELNPTTMLIARKTGKKVAPGQTVTVQVRNPDLRLSNEFTYTRPVETTHQRTEDNCPRSEVSLGGTWTRGPLSLQYTVTGVTAFRRHGY